MFKQVEKLFKFHGIDSHGVALGEWPHRLLRLGRLDDIWRDGVGDFGAPGQDASWFEAGSFEERTR